MRRQRRRAPRRSADDYDGDYDRDYDEDYDGNYEACYAKAVRELDSAVACVDEGKVLRVAGPEQRVR